MTKEELLKILKEIEWRGSTEPQWEESCPYCSNAKSEKHDKDCKLRLAITWLFLSELGDHRK